MEYNATSLQLVPASRLSDGKADHRVRVADQCVDLHAGSDGSVSVLLWLYPVILAVPPHPPAVGGAVPHVGHVPSDGHHVPGQPHSVWTHGRWGNDQDGHLLHDIDDDILSGGKPLQGGEEDSRGKDDGV